MPPSGFGEFSWEWIFQGNAWVGSGGQGVNGVAGKGNPMGPEGFFKNFGKSSVQIANVFHFQTFRKFSENSCLLCTKIWI